MREITQALLAPPTAHAALPWVWVSLGGSKEPCTCAQHIISITHKWGRAIRREETWRGGAPAIEVQLVKVALDHELSPAAHTGRCASRTKHLRTSAPTYERVGGFSSYAVAKALKGYGHTSDRAWSSAQKAPSLACDAHMMGALSRYFWDGLRRHGAICWPCYCQRSQTPN